MNRLILLALCLAAFFSSCHRGDKPHSPASESDSASIEAMLGRLKGATLPFDSAMEITFKARDRARTGGYRKGEARALFEQGVLLYRENQNKQAMEVFLEAEQIARTLDDRKLLAWCLERIGAIRMSSDAGLAFKNYLEALPLFQQAGDSNGMAKVFNIMGFYYSEQGAFDSAKAYYDKAMVINKRLGQEYPLIENRGNLAMMYESQGRFDLAAGIYRELTDRLVLMHDSMSLQIILYNFGSLYQKLGNLDSSRYYLERAIAVAGPVGDSVLLATLYGNLGEILWLQRKTREAESCFLASVALSRSVDDAETERQALRFLQKIDSLRRDTEGLYRHEMRIGALTDTICRRKMRNDLNATRLGYESEMRQGVILLQEQKIRAADSEKTQYRILLALAGLITVLVFLVFILERRNHRKNKQLAADKLTIRELQLEKARKEKDLTRLRMQAMESDLKQKERELLISAMTLEQKREFLGAIARRIRAEVSGDNITDPLQVVNDIISSIRMQITTDGETELFNRQFTTVHDAFMENLRRAHPALTRSELRFCAYLRMNMPGRQIAESLNVTSEAIRKTRYRIRKKIGLAKEQSLEEYLSGF